MNKLFKSGVCLVNSILPIKKKVVLFSSFFGQYNDNPKAVSERLHKLAPDVDIVWVKSIKAKEPFPSYVKTLDLHSKEYYKMINRAQVIVDNHMGMRASGYWGDKGLRKIFAKVFSRKRKSQLCISTWHGTPLKRIAADTIGASEKKRHYTNTDFVVAGCELSREKFISAFLNSVPVKNYGTPRNDALINGSEDLVQLKNKLGLPLDKKIILFAPTFRNSVENSGIKQMQEFDFERMLNSLQNKFGGEWCFVFRVHNNVLLKIDVQSLTEKFGERIINGNKCDDMVEYMICCDVLITDYSGSMFDFALTGKPCFLYSHDKDDYEKKERGFYFDYNSLPFPKSLTTEEFYFAIDNFDQEQYANNIDKFLKEIGNFEEGKAAERVVNDILSFIKEQDKQKIIDK